MGGWVKKKTTIASCLFLEVRYDSLAIPFHLFVQKLTF